MHRTAAAVQSLSVEHGRGAGPAGDRPYVMRQAMPNLVCTVSILTMSLWGLTGPWPGNLNWLVGIPAVAGIIAAFVLARRADARRGPSNQSSTATSPDNPPMQRTDTAGMGAAE